MFSDGIYYKTPLWTAYLKLETDNQTKLRWVHKRRQFPHAVFRSRLPSSRVPGPATAGLDVPVLCTDRFDLRR